MSAIAAVLIGVSLLYISTTARLESYIKMLMLQGILLFMVAAGNAHDISFTSIIIIGVETILFKSIMIPLFLLKTIRKNQIKSDVESYFSGFTSLFIVTAILTLGFLTAYLSASSNAVLEPLYFGISISAMLTGFFIIATRKKLITHIMGYMILENGIFLLSLSAAKEMPFIVNLGVSMDIFIGVFLAGIFINRIKTNFDQHDIDDISRLKD
ncbi:MAG TPA: hypothetical protein PK624_07045 [Spirochaetota bacterium]|nr:hypothetical protein [Spirochaetota bacterium]HOR44535.1 hypothetical protein [Spirochaetota bacterium]HOU84310.1 hypothetical protein [Spirochaetota bacterium]HPK56424.1 hypothetical protein [Spirochaetota bacterium]